MMLVMNRRRVSLQIQSTRELSVKPSIQKILKNDTNEGTQRTVPRLSAKENWARVFFRLKDISSKNKGETIVVFADNLYNNSNRALILF